MESVENKDLKVLYEDLRKEGINDSPNYRGGSKGLYLFISKGMAAWIEAWKTYTVEEKTAKPAREIFARDETCSNLNEELVNILTNMALEAYQEA